MRRRVEKRPSEKKTKSTTKGAAHGDALHTQSDWVSIDSLHAWEKNPRKNNAAIPRVARSIRRFGFVAPIVVDTKLDRMVAGDTRLKAMRSLLAEEPAFVPKGAPGPGLVRVVFHEFDNEAEANAYALADNRLNEIAEWDDGMLLEIVREIQEAQAPNDDIVLVAGFDSSYIEELSRTVEASVGSGADGDDSVKMTFDVFAQDDVAKRTFEWFRTNGFPYPNEPTHVQMQQINRLASKSGEALRTTSDAHHVADNYNHHRYATKVTGKRTVVEGFEMDAVLQKAIKLELESGGICGAGVLGSFAYANGVQAAANFRPGFAAYMYRRYGVADGVVLDPSMGFGGRLVGWLASLLKGRYIGIDPNVPTFEGNMRLVKALMPKRDVVLINQPFEDVDLSPYKSTVNFAFTSPPYFCKEQYSNDATQSWKRYPEFQGWVDGFLRPMMNGVASTLVAGGIVAINIADVKIGTTLHPCEAETSRAGVDAGLKHIDTLRFPMARAPGQGEKLERFEPVFVFSKKKTSSRTTSSSDASEKSSDRSDSVSGSEMKPWQNGIALDVLVPIAKQYADYNARSMSPFSQVKKNDIANWLSKCELVQRDALYAKVTTCKSKSKITMCGDTIIAHKHVGDVTISHVASDAASLRKLLASQTAERVWLYLWAGDTTLASAARDEGFTYVDGKVTSFGELFAIYVRAKNTTATLVPAIDRLNIVKLFDVDATRIARIAERVQKKSLTFAVHYSNYNQGKAWSAVSLRGYSDDPAFIEKPSEMNDEWHAKHAGESHELQDTALFDEFPDVRQLLAKSLPGAVLHRVRLMRLAPGGGELLRHTDQVDAEMGTKFGRLMRLHFPIKTSERVLFSSWALDDTKLERNMRAGECWYLDIRKPHCAINGGDEERIHLVVDVEVNEALIAAALAASS